MSQVVIEDAHTLPAERWWKHGYDCPTTFSQFTYGKCLSDECGGVWVVTFTDPYQGHRSVYATHLAALMASMPEGGDHE